MKPGNNYWLIEQVQPGHAHMYGVDRVIYSGDTPHQRVDVFEARLWGRCLALDGNLQSAQFDEYIYHEALVHPAMVLHPQPQNIMVAGGGEGAILREIFKHPSVARVVMVDLDERVVEICREYLPDWSRGSFSDARLKLVYGDARRYLEKTEEKFDIIFLDLPEPFAGGPCYLLYTKEFYRTVFSRLRAGGAIALQADNLNGRLLDCHGSIAATIKQVFPRMYSYSAFIPSYDANWGFIYAQDSPTGQAPPVADVANIDPSFIDGVLDKRGIGDLLFYDGITHRYLFSLPKDIRRLLQGDYPIIEDSNPLCK